MARLEIVRFRIVRARAVTRRRVYRADEPDGFNSAAGRKRAFFLGFSLLHSGLCSGKLWLRLFVRRRDSTGGQDG